MGGFMHHGHLISASQCRKLQLPAKLAPVRGNNLRKEVEIESKDHPPDMQSVSGAHGMKAYKKPKLRKK
jgi:hypothetical protein